MSDDDRLSDISQLQAGIRQIISQGRMDPGTEERIVVDVLDGDYKLPDREDKPEPEGYGGQS